jgi:hypothetical protein
MGTRATYRFIEQHEDSVLTIHNSVIGLLYGHYDGYPTGVPCDIAEYISRGTSDGYPIRFNGGGCLFANIVWKLKEGKSSYFYLNPIESRGRCWEDYLYDIIVTPKGKVMMACYTNQEHSRNDVVFYGTAEEFYNKYNTNDSTEEK